MAADKVFEPGPNRVFVFGSNLAGIHGAGAAQFAHAKCGAIWGQGIGLAGNSYGIPTKDKEICTLPLKKVGKYVQDFLEFASGEPHLSFFVTKIGCGLAGFTEAEIAPLFKDAPANCELPDGWR